jgi:hypothetical protein
MRGVLRTEPFPHSVVSPQHSVLAYLAYSTARVSRSTITLM